MGIPDDEIYCFNNILLSELNKEWRKLSMRVCSMCNDNKRMFIFVYCAGHGVADQ